MDGRTYGRMDIFLLIYVIRLTRRSWPNETHNSTSTEHTNNVTVWVYVCPCGSSITQKVVNGLSSNNELAIIVYLNNLHWYDKTFQIMLTSILVLQNILVTAIHYFLQICIRNDTGNIFIKCTIFRLPLVFTVLLTTLLRNNCKENNTKMQNVFNYIKTLSML